MWRASILHAETKWRDALTSAETAAMLKPLGQHEQLVLAECYSHTFQSVVDCSALARQLLSLCVWAGDEGRSAQLGALLARLSHSDQTNEGMISR